MKTRVGKIILVLVTIVICGFFLSIFNKEILADDFDVEKEATISDEVPLDNDNTKYIAYSYDVKLREFHVLLDAKDAIKQLGQGHILNMENNVMVWNNYYRYIFKVGNNYILSMEELEVTEELKNDYSNGYIIDQEEGRLVWSNFDRALFFDASTKQGDLKLVSSSYPVGSQHIPKPLINLSKVTCKYLRVNKSDMNIHVVAYHPLLDMLKAAYNDGVKGMVVVSTYRSYDRQTVLFNNRVNQLKGRLGIEKAKIEAATVVATPGSSEHQTALAIDFSSMSEGGGILPLNSSFGDTKEGKWLRENAWRYGFILRYEEDKMDITGIIYEPWHYRYVGIPHAEYMTKNNMPLELYLETLGDNKTIKFTNEKMDSYHIHYFASIYSEELLEFLNNNKTIKSISGDGKGGIIVTLKI